MALGPTAERRGLDAGPFRRILARLAGPAVRGGVGAMFLGGVVADGMGAHKRALVCQLYRSRHDRHLDLLSPPRPSGPIHGPGE